MPKFELVVEPAGNLLIRQVVEGQRFKPDLHQIAETVDVVAFAGSEHARRRYG